MPKFHLSSSEAAELTDYFAAESAADFPYHSDPRGRLARWAEEPAGQIRSQSKALGFLVDRTTFCAKCHLLEDYSPGGDLRTGLAPRLDRVAGRIRPEYLRRWLANPKSQLPYTAMPVNFPPDKFMGQEIYPGTSVEQLDAVVDLLINYGRDVQGRAWVRRMLESASHPEPAESGTTKKNTSERAPPPPAK
jgi:hypothetical protein